MAGNVNTAPRSLWRKATRFTALILKQRATKGDTNYGDDPNLVPLTIQLAPNATSDAVQIVDSAGLNQGTVLRVARAKYDFAVDGGAQGAIVPKVTCKLPANALILGGQISVPTAVTSAGAATVSVGTSAGSSATSLLVATGKASFTLAALLNTAATFAAPVKLSAAGNINITVATADLTAGVIEIFVVYAVATA